MAHTSGSFILRLLGGTDLIVCAITQTLLPQSYTLTITRTCESQGQRMLAGANHLSTNEE